MLRDDPDWSGAAEILIDGCAHLPNAEERVRWLERLCLSLGDSLYPGFLHVLCRVGEHGDAAAQKTVADTLVLALQSGRLPSGRHSAWGAATQGGAKRAMGPIEYLCAWHAQPDSRGPLGAPAFDRAARAVLGLVSHSETARRLYCAKLLNDAEDPLGGAWSRGTRRALQALVRAWSAADSGRISPQAAAANAVDAFLGALRQSDGDTVSSVAAGWIPPLR